MKRAYDHDAALALRPLLVSIAVELDERSAAIKSEGAELEASRGGETDPVRTANRMASIANHKRELRHALEELAALGCEAEPGRRSTILIPGPDGDLASGFRVDGGGELSRAVELELA